MTAPMGPHLDERRTADFVAELRQCARAWIPAWELDDGERDFGRALLEIAARFNSEVAERLDRGADKMRRGFLDWLAVRGEAARPARVPVVMKLADTAPGAVLAARPVRLQADANGTAVVFETETDVRVVPGRLDAVIATDAGLDAYYLPPPGLSDLQPLEPLPSQWRPKSFAAAGATRLQLDPELGLLPGVIFAARGQHYRIVAADKDLVTIEPPLATELNVEEAIEKVTAFAPFDGEARNWQAHALYLGDEDLLNVEAAATIDVVGAGALREGITWQYWGKRDPDDEVGWQTLAFDDGRQNTVSDAVTLRKPKGAIEPRDIGGRNSRWIRAFRPNVGAADTPFTTEDFTIRVNASACKASPCPPASATASPAADALANTTPLVLDNVFLPLGREPRQFDAFYLGSKEAFSKAGAEVQLCFELADPTFSAIAVVRAGIFANTVLAGVGKDRALHLLEFSPAAGAIDRFRDRGELRPPLPADAGGTPTQTVPVNLNPACRPVIASLFDDFYVSVASGGSIWIWHENALDKNSSGWIEFQRLPDGPDARIDDIVPVTKAGVGNVVLANGALWVHDFAAWTRQQTEDPSTVPATPVTLASLVPALVLDLNGDAVPGPDMVGVSIDNLLYQVATDGVCTALPLDFGGNDIEFVDAGDANRPGIRPAVYPDAQGMAVVAVDTTLTKLLLFHNTAPNATVERIDLPPGDEVIGAAVGVALVNNVPQFFVTCKTPTDATYVASWQPTHPQADVRGILFRTSLSAPGRLGGTPAALPAHLVVPGAQGDLFVATLDPSRRQILAAAASEDGVVVPDSAPAFAVDDEFSVLDDTNLRIVRAIDSAGVVKAPQILYPVDSPFGPVAADPEALGYFRSAPQFSGTPTAADKVELDNSDTETVAGTYLLIDDGISVELYEVVDVTGTPPVADIVPSLGATPASVDYWTPTPVMGRVAPIIRLNPNTTGNWDASLLDHARFYFPSANPEVQRGKAFDVNATNNPEIIALQSAWQQAPAANDTYVIDGVIGEWQHVLADTSANPELSWEYSNGTAWESLILKEDSTLHLKNTGVVRFTVPADLAAVDWAGKTNHWIRARLIGGDYGREKVTVKIKTISATETEQTVERSSEGIRPPVVVKLHISYGVCAEVRPDFVLAEDSGSTRDQSDANRTGGAIVEAFVPLAVTLGRLSGPAPIAAPPEDCPPPCRCDSEKRPAATGEATSQAAVPATPPAEGRAIFIGLSAAPSGAPVNVLLLVEGERDHTAFAPLTVEALVADRFVPIVVNDATRGLGESGILTMSFAVPPTPRELFGRTLTWLRLTPAEGPGDWRPTLRGAYLNAVSASATETLTRELLGSSDGAPNLAVYLQRPPLLRGTLELRVKEPLGEEERAELKKDDETRVVTDPDGLPGDWVRWRQVIDPNDEPPNERVYALDEGKGEVRFGDGRHGMIPPIGRDSIVAFSYQRTETGATGTEVPANSITARAPLNLVSPVESVESVIAADQAAGGAPPEPLDRVLRFGFARLRHRNRAVTARDLEDLALQSSPDIVQARARVRPSGVRLTVVMRGNDPQPTSAQARELRRLLLSAAPAALAGQGVLRIEGPRVRRLRVDLQLRVETLDHAGAVARDVKERLVEFFDTATGGARHDGWALGINPSEDDVALALIAAPRLDGIGAVALREILTDDSDRPWPAAIARTDLVMLDDDPVRIEFETAEVLV